MVFSCESSQPPPLIRSSPNSGYDSGYINGVTGSKVFIHLIEGPDADALTSSHNSLIVSILSAGTFFGEFQPMSIFGIVSLTKHLLQGALIAGDLADWYGRRPTIIAGCAIYIVGCVLQAASNGLALIVSGRLIAGIGVGFVSAIIILYMSEICPRKVRGSLVSGYQFCECDLFPSRVPSLSHLLHRYHSWSTSRVVCHLRHRETDRHGIIPYSDQPPICLGFDPRHWSLPPPRISPLLRQERKGRPRSYRARSTSRSTRGLGVHHL